MREKIRLTSEYFQGIDFEIINESITNEIAWHIARVTQLGDAHPDAGKHAKAVDSLEDTRALISTANPESLVIAATLLDAMRTLHPVETAA